MRSLGLQLGKWTKGGVKRGYRGLCDHLALKDPDSLRPLVREGLWAQDSGGIGLGSG